MKRIAFNKQQTKHELRRLSLDAICKFATTADGNGVQGYAAIWDALSSDRGGYLACFPKGSMVLPDYAVRFLYNHNDDWLLATESNHTLVFSEDERGVLVAATLDDTFIDQYVKTKVAKQTINGMSIGMYPIEFHRETRVISAEDASQNSELVALVGQSVNVEVYDQWLLDEITATGQPAFPQTSLESFRKANKGSTEDNAEINSTYIAEVELIDLMLDE